MKVVKQKVEVLWCPPIPLERIEEAGRTAYLSQGQMTDGSAKKFVDRLIRLGHGSVLEHVTMSLKFVTNIGVGRELLRHRLASPTEQSTRYVNFSGREMRFIEPVWWEAWSGEEQDTWTWTMAEAEKAYRRLIKKVSSPQQVRDVLPLALATEIALTANLREWRHIFQLRALGTTGRPHPQMQALMACALEMCANLVPVVFDDLAREARVQGLLPVDAGCDESSWAGPMAEGV
jgi:thymidylate synthase (FAD)